MHKENCNANHFGNSGSMEVSGAIEIFQSSESLHGLLCTKFLGDGDSRAYKAVKEMQPYGDTDDHGRLTDAEIDKLQRYYGLAIRNNTGSINSMKQVIWATYFHKASTDAYPQHGLCPTNEDTCCEYNRAITNGEVYKQKNTLPSEMHNCIKNVYWELTTPNHLAKCLHVANVQDNSPLWQSQLCMR
ncbi:uncharacterized protein TNCV_2396542 [Trichonephila clavipes]|uniref:Mutator-like transposase domain-containing protein n=1 Tax=Trichonephila clavipes TaxID=2585209 RepID=A0A8X6T1Y2_TRICX|nr:uncharacterized protein TNCV_2396542 [Trichonephila clavipes]